MKKKWILVFLTIGFGLFLAEAGEITAAEKFPNRAITLYPGMTAGGGLYMYTRVIAEKASQLLGVPVLVEAKPGAGGTISAQFIARARPDGYSLLVVIPGCVSNAEYLLSKVAYKNTDFEYFGQFGTTETFLYVMSERPWKSLEELVAHGRKYPEELKYGSISINQHIQLKKFCDDAGFKATQVPMKGDTEVISAMVGGHIDFAQGWVSSLLAMKEAGKMRLLAGFTDQRSKFFPEIATFAEKGYPEVAKIFTEGTFYGIAGPKGIPKEASEVLRNTFAKVFQDKEVHAKLEKLGFTPAYVPSDEFWKKIRMTEERYRKMYKELGYEIQNPEK
jgi:tripartite-type tricarboxylate transporter receptor subunit TctC